MAAHEQVNINQFPDTVPAGYLRNKVYPQDVALYRTESARKDRQAMWRDKLANTKKTGFYDDVKARGVLEPVHVVHDPHFGPELHSGHHRVAAAANISHQMPVPVRHFPNYTAYQEFKQSPDYAEEDNPNWRKR